MNEQELVRIREKLALSTYVLDQVRYLWRTYQRDDEVRRVCSLVLECFDSCPMARLMDHADATDDILADAQQDASLFVEQGRAEERRRIKEVIGGMLDDLYYVQFAHGLRDALSRIDRPPVVELLPPSAARAEADRLRNALREIIEADTTEHGTSRASDIASKALEGAS